MPEPLAEFIRRGLQVLRMLIEGLTDQEIADLLFVSRRTATSHACIFLARLDRPSRDAAGAVEPLRILYKRPHRR